VLTSVTVAVNVTTAPAMDVEELKASVVEDVPAVANEKTALNKTAAAIRSRKTVALAAWRHSGARVMNSETSQVLDHPR
jgi:hypothetical protein